MCGLLDALSAPQDDYQNLIDFCRHHQGLPASLLLFLMWFLWLLLHVLHSMACICIRTLLLVPEQTW